MKAFLRYLVQRNRIGLAGGAIFLLLAAMALVPGWFAPHDPLAMTPAAMAPPGPEFPLGSDRYGRDILSRIVYGLRVSFSVGILAVAVATLVGSALGMVAGYFGRGVDYLIMRVMDTIFAFPSLLLAIALAAVMGAGLPSVIVAIGIIYTPIFARVARAPTLSVKEQEFVTAAVAIGGSSPRILFRHVLPNILTPIVVQMALSLSSAVIVEAALSFLGLGAVPPTPSLGSMLSEARAFMELAPWTVLYPGLALAGLVLSVNLLGDAVQDLLDPHHRGEGIRG